MVTVKWSEQQGASQEIGADGKIVWRDSVTFQVTEAPTEADAYGQLEYTIGSDHPVYGDNLKVSAIIPQRKGPNAFWEMRVIWSSDAAGTPGTINQRATISWGEDIIVEDVDRDYDGHAITNSVGDPPVNTPTRDFEDLILNYTRWEPGYDVRKRLRIVGAINNDNFTIRFGSGAFNGSGGVFGGGKSLGVMKGECKCIAYTPLGEYEETQSRVQVVYRWKLRERLLIKGGDTESTADDAWASGFDWRFMDQGNRAGYLDGTTYRKGALFLRSNEESTELVRLNGYGVPVDTSIKVTSAMSEPFEFSALPAGAELDDRWLNADPPAAHLIYKRNKRITFKGLIPLFR